MDQVSGDRELDVVVFGATGFVGRLVAGYLADHAPPGVRIGLAGRSERRLADIRARLGSAASSWPLLVADSADPASLAALARAARVVATTVGPYRRRGLALVEACASAGTDYADLTGEVLFMRESIDRYHGVAAGTGARIVHSCGFDSIPSDLGVLLLHHAARADDAGDLEDTTLVVIALRGAPVRAPSESSASCSSARRAMSPAWSTRCNTPGSSSAPPIPATGAPSWCDSASRASHSSRTGAPTVSTARRSCSVGSPLTISSCSARSWTRFSPACAPPTR